MSSIQIVCLLTRPIFNLFEVLKNVNEIFDILKAITIKVATNLFETIKYLHDYI